MRRIYFFHVEEDVFSIPMRDRPSIIVSVQIAHITCSPVKKKCMTLYDAVFWCHTIGLIQNFHNYPLYCCLSTMHAILMYFSFFYLTFLKIPLKLKQVLRKLRWSSKEYWCINQNKAEIKKISDALFEITNNTEQTNE